MIKKINKVGLTLVLLYIFIMCGLYIFIYSRIDWDWTATLLMMVPFLPWDAIDGILGTDIGNFLISFYEDGLLLGSIVINVVNATILYCIGLILSYIFKKLNIVLKDIESRRGRVWGKN